jgi:membrane protein required for colicin V production
LIGDTEIPVIDLIVGAVVFVAVLRGLFIGLIREGLSLASIGAATIVTRLFIDPVAVQLTEITGGEITGKAAYWIAGVLLVVATILASGFVARLIRKSVTYAGLGWADRLGGGALGAAEGGIIGAVLVLIALWLVGPDHVTTEGARSVEIVQDLRDRSDEGDLPSVASPGDWF